MNMNWRRLLFSGVTVAALAVGLALLTAGAAFAYDDTGAPTGEWRVPGGDIVPDPGGGSGGGGNPGGPAADPDTFEIDSWRRGDVRPVDTPAVEPVAEGVSALLARILAWLAAILEGR